MSLSREIDALLDKKAPIGFDEAFSTLSDQRREEFYQHIDKILARCTHSNPALIERVLAAASQVEISKDVLTRALYNLIEQTKECQWDWDMVIAAASLIIHGADCTDPENTIPTVFDHAWYVNHHTHYFALITFLNLLPADLPTSQRRSLLTRALQALVDYQVMDPDTWVCAALLVSAGANTDLRSPVSYSKETLSDILLETSYTNSFYFFLFLQLGCKVNEDQVLEAMRRFSFAERRKLSLYSRFANFKNPTTAVDDGLKTILLNEVHTAYPLLIPRWLEKLNLPDNEDSRKRVLDPAFLLAKIDYEDIRLEMEFLDKLKAQNESQLLKNKLLSFLIILYNAKKQPDYSSFQRLPSDIIILILRQLMISLRSDSSIKMPGELTSDENSIEQLIRFVAREYAQIEESLKLKAGLTILQKTKKEQPEQKSLSYHLSARAFCRHFKPSTATQRTDPEMVRVNRIATAKKCFQSNVGLFKTPTDFVATIAMVKDHPAYADVNWNELYQYSLQP